MKILFISTLYFPDEMGGAEKVVRNLAESLSSEGHQCAVLTLKEGGRLERGRVGPVEVFRVPVRNWKWPYSRDQRGRCAKFFWHLLDTYNVFANRTIGRVVEELNPDVVNTHNISGFSVAVWATINRLKVPVVHALHDQYLMCPKSTMYKNGQVCSRQCSGCRAFSYPKLLSSNLPDAVVGVSQFILKKHEAFGYFSSVRRKSIIRNSYIGTVGKRKERDGDVVRFGYLGRLDESKGVHVLLDAFSTLGRGAELLLAGKGDPDYEAELRAAHSNNENVVWLGHVDKADLLSVVDVLVVPSIWEDTAPLVVLEALSWGIPVVGSNVGGIPEFVPEEVGWLFSSRDSEELACIMSRCVEDRSELLCKSRGALRFSEGFSLEIMKSEYLQIFGSVANCANEES